MSRKSTRTVPRPALAWKTAAGLLLILAVTVVVHSPALHGSFLWDDDGHVTLPELRSLDGLRRIWFELGATQQYYPMLHSAFWLEHRLWGDAVLGYHLVNVLLHGVSACLLVVIGNRLLVIGERGASIGAVPGHPSPVTNHRLPVTVIPWLAGLIFAVHPLTVESVAWITEQKNTLSLVFYLLAGLAYLRWRGMSESENESESEGEDGGSRSERGGASGGAASGSHPHFHFHSYLLATALFVLALLTKSVTATLPGALLVVLWWRKGRLVRSDVLPLLPWFALGATAGLFTAWVERHYIGAQGELYELGAVERCLLAARATWFYLGKLVWPADLSFIYPRWDVTAESPGWWPFLVAGLLLTLALWWWSRRRRGPLAAWLFFVGSLFPALGFVNVYPFRFSYVADHFGYIALVGGVVFLAAALVELAGRRPRVLAAAVVVLASVLASLAWRQSATYRSNEALWRATVARNPRSWLAQNDLAQALLNQGRVDEAIAEFVRALPLRPGDPEPENNLALALVAAGRFDEAFARYETALRIRPEYAEAWSNLGVAKARVGRLAEAAAHLENALRLRPEDDKVRHNLGLALENLGALLLESGRNAEGIAALERATALDPEKAITWYNLGLGYVREKRWADAARAFRAVTGVAPEFVDAHLALALVLEESGGSAAEIAAARAAAARLRERGN